MYTINLDDVEEIIRFNAKVKLSVSKNTFSDLTEASQGLLILEPGIKMENHIHEDNIEFFFPISGSAELFIDKDSYIIQPGISAYVPKGVPHYIINNSEIEFKTVFTHIPHI